MLAELRVAHAALSDRAAARLVGMIRGLGTLERLDLSENALGDHWGASGGGASWHPDNSISYFSKFGTAVEMNGVNTPRPAL